jgi:hypothetical protein
MVTNIFMIERFEVEKRHELSLQRCRILYAWNGEISSHVDGEIQIQMERKRCKGEFHKTMNFALQNFTQFKGL